jgi:hypothetical protein
MVQLSEEDLVVGCEEVLGGTQLRSRASWDGVPVDDRLTEGHGQRSGEHGANADGDRRNTDAGEQTGGEEK